MALRGTDGQAGLPRWFEQFFAVLGRIERGAIEVRLPDGRLFVAGGAGAGPRGRIEVVNPEMFGRLIREGELGFAEMYVDGWWESPDLQALMDAILLNNEAISRPFTGAALVRAYERLRHWLRGNSRTGSRRNISHHYDLGNDFYALWLDPTMTYSSALFVPETPDLVEAQTNKYRAICDRMDLRPGQHVLEIGCGWGGFAEYAIRERGARVTGLTLSREQADYAQRRLFEAVGERYWPTFFAALHERLRPGAVASMQVITVADHLFAGYRSGTDFIQKYIFPGGMLPSPSAFRQQVERAGLDLIDSIDFGNDYSQTLRAWRARFNARWSEIARLGFDTRFRRMWDFYLASCAACFAAGTTDVSQLGLRRVA